MVVRDASTHVNVGDDGESLGAQDGGAASEDLVLAELEQGLELDGLAVADVEAVNGKGLLEEASAVGLVAQVEDLAAGSELERDIASAAAVGEEGLDAVVDAVLLLLGLQGRLRELDVSSSAHIPRPAGS
jgi:hypothetical protein